MICVNRRAWQKHNWPPWHLYLRMWSVSILTLYAYLEYDLCHLCGIAVEYLANHFLEYDLCQSWGLTEAYLATLTFNAAKASFADDSRKKEILKVNKLTVHLHWKVNWTKNRLKNNPKIISWVNTSLFYLIVFKIYGLFWL